jgi:hypothetical protein
MKNEMTDAIYGSLMDEAYEGLDQLETKVNGLYPNVETEGYLHLILLNAIIFRMVCNGWTKEDLLEQVSNGVDDATTFLNEQEST